MAESEKPTSPGYQKSSDTQSEKALAHAAQNSMQESVPSSKAAKETDLYHVAIAPAGTTSPIIALETCTIESSRSLPQARQPESFSDILRILTTKNNSPSFRSDTLSGSTTGAHQNIPGSKSVNNMASPPLRPMLTAPKSADIFRPHTTLISPRRASLDIVIDRIGLDTALPAISPLKPSLLGFIDKKGAGIKPTPLAEENLLALRTTNTDLPHISPIKTLYPGNPSDMKSETNLLQINEAAALSRMIQDHVGMAEFIASPVKNQKMDLDINDTNMPVVGVLSPEVKYKHVFSVDSRGRKTITTTFVPAEEADDAKLGLIETCSAVASSIDSKDPYNSPVMKQSPSKDIFPKSGDSSPLSDLNHVDFDSYRNSPEVSKISVPCKINSNLAPTTLSLEAPPIKRGRGRPKKIRPLVSVLPLPKKVVRKRESNSSEGSSETEISSSNSSVSQTKPEKEKHIVIPKPMSWRRESIASESGSLSNLNDSETVLLPDRKRPILSSSINLPDRSGRTLIFKYSAKGDFETTRILIEAGADLSISDFAGWTPLHEACLEGHSEVVKLMLQNYADVNAKGGDGDTPLHDAIGNGHIKVVKYLLRYGGSLISVNENGQTPLEFAEHKLLLTTETEKIATIIQVLKNWMEMDIIVRQTDSFGRTNLHLAAASGNSTKMLELLKYGANVAVSDNSGLIPLHGSALNGHLKCVEILLQYGSNFDLKNKQRSTPLNDAASNGHAKCVELMLSYGADPSLVILASNVRDEAKTSLRRICSDLCLRPSNSWKPLMKPVFSPRIIGPTGMKRAVDDSKFKQREVEVTEIDEEMPEALPPLPFSWGGLDNRQGPFESSREEKKFKALWQKLAKQDDVDSSSISKMSREERDISAVEDTLKVSNPSPVKLVALPVRKIRKEELQVTALEPIKKVHRIDVYIYFLS